VEPVLRGLWSRRDGNRDGGIGEECRSKPDPPLDFPYWRGAMGGVKVLE
jgi:hypothetical protein